MIALIVHLIPRGDLKLVNHSLVWIKDAEYARQRIETTLDLFLGEWFLDLRIGLPYFRDILIKNPNSDLVKSVFRRAIMNTPGVVSVPTLEYEADSVARRATVTFEAVYQDGTVIPRTVDLIL
jgi:hypothetical protein